LRVFLLIDGQSHYLRLDPGELVGLFLVIGQLPIAKGSPISPVEKKYASLSLYVIRNAHFAAANSFGCDMREYLVIFQVHYLFLL
jgi:hypothetical protein